MGELAVGAVSEVTSNVVGVGVVSVKVGAPIRIDTVKDVGVDVGDTVCPTTAGTNNAEAVVRAGVSNTGGRVSSISGAGVSKGKQTARA